MFMTVRERVEEMPEKAKRIQQKPQKAKLTHKYSTPLLIALCIILAVVTIILVYMMRNHIAAKDGAKEQLQLVAIQGVISAVIGRHTPIVAVSLKKAFFDESFETLF